MGAFALFLLLKFDPQLYSSSLIDIYSSFTFIPKKGALMAKPLTSLTVPTNMKPRYDEIVVLTDAFCLEKLNEEYAKLVRLATATLARKRPSPLQSGNVSTCDSQTVISPR